MKNEKEFVGHIDQLFKVNKYQMLNGKADGVKILDIHNGSGLNFNINLDRGMDIPYLSFKGKNVGYISPCGIVAPQYFDDNGLGFLKGFTAGFLTTCGLQVIGIPCSYEGEEYGLHGRISNTPADNYSYEIKQNAEDTFGIEIEGIMSEGRIFDNRLSLKRNIKCFYQKKKVLLTDQVRNEGYNKARHMILYHFNIGYPFLSPNSELIIPTINVKPRDEHSASKLKDWNKIQPPTPGYKEMCYYHKLKGDIENMATVIIYNPDIEMGISIKYDLITLDNFVQWKMMGQQDYVIGLEPANATIDGIEDAMNNGSIKYLQAGESVEYKLEFNIIEGKKEFKALKDQIV